MPELKLFADPEYWKVPKEQREAWGCGPGGIGDYLVPDTVWGLSVKPACMIHDWYYRMWPKDDEVERERADRIFLNNMIRIVFAARSGKWLMIRRLKRCDTYFNMVRRFGGPAWWEERNKEGEYQGVRD